MNAVADQLEQIPGVDRRHRFGDLLHERTNFRFMRHRKRMLIAFVAVIVVSISSLLVFDLNLGIDFEGGVSWSVEMADSKDASIAAVRDRLAPLGFEDTKITTTNNAQANTTTVRVQSAEIANDPVKQVRDAIAEAIDATPAEVTADAKGMSVTFSALGIHDADQKKVESAVKKVDGVDAEVTIVPGTDGSNVIVVVDEMPASERDGVTAALAKYAGREVSDVSINTVGPTWGKEVSKKALYALLMFFAVLAVYLSLRFEFKMAASAIIAVIHDIIFTVGVYAIVGFEVTPATVTAFLTILGFSLYDTVVVFDKVKENAVNVGGKLSYAGMVDQALNQVLMRSLSTSLVALLPVASLLIVGSFILGATALEEFALALFAGLFIGTYSSIVVAAPALCTWKERESRYAAVRGRGERTRPNISERSPLRVENVNPETGSKVEWDATGVPGPAAVKRTNAPRPRSQRGRKR